MKINKAQLLTECLNALKMQRDRQTYTNRTPLPVQLTEDDLTFKRNTLIDNYNAIVKERALLDSQIQSGTLNNHSENNVYSNNKKNFTDLFQIM